MTTEREKDIEAAEWLARDGRMYRERDASAIGLWTKEAEMCERAAQALRERAERDGAVPMPRNEDEAVGMALIGESWLRHNAPHRLKANKENGNGD